MKERPILFSAPMVRALLNNSKTQTRRAVKPDHLAFFDQSPADMLGAWGTRPLPYGKTGDRLWVRETYFAWGRWETRPNAKKGRDEWHFVDATEEMRQPYIFETPPDWKPVPRYKGTMLWYWKRPAIFMPRAASRITLEITGVRVERLQDISDQDALAEGVELWGKGSLSQQGQSAGPIEKYQRLWQSINGPESWDANPWVWVVEFKKLA